MQTCRSLADAHDNGLIHRDIKPQYIMVSKLSSETDFVKVVDFGMVKDVEEADDNMKTRVLRGTPLYTAPERFRDPSQMSNVKIDIYALGATAYKMCSGRNLFSAATELALINEVLSSEHLPLEKVCPDCPPELTQLIMRCVARNPEDRPNSMREVMQVFSQIQSQGIIRWTAEDSEDWWNRHPELLLDESLVSQS